MLLRTLATNIIIEVHVSTTGYISLTCTGRSYLKVVDLLLGVLYVKMGRFNRIFTGLEKAKTINKALMIHPYEKWNNFFSFCVFLQIDNNFVLFTIIFIFYCNEKKICFSL